MSRTCRMTAALPESVHRLLNSYALAATAAGMGVLALAQPTEAKIIYTETHRVIGGNKSFLLDLNHDGTTDFTLKNFACQSTGTCTSNSVNSLILTGASGTVVEGTTRLGRSHFWASAVKAGVLISGKKNLRNPAVMEYRCRGICPVTSVTHSTGKWDNVRNRYLGLRFLIDAKPHFGWARFSVKSSRYPFELTATLTGYAYETIPNKPIITGKTHGPDVITVEPGSVGALAAGSVGLDRRSPLDFG